MLERKRNKNKTVQMVKVKNDARSNRRLIMASASENLDEEAQGSFRITHPNDNLQFYQYNNVNLSLSNIISDPASKDVAIQNETLRTNVFDLPFYLTKNTSGNLASIIKGVNYNDNNSSTTKSPLSRYSYQVDSGDISSLGVNYIKMCAILPKGFTSRSYQRKQKDPFSLDEVVPTGTDGSKKMSFVMNGEPGWIWKGNVINCIYMGNRNAGRRVISLEMANLTREPLVSNDQV